MTEVRAEVHAEVREEVRAEVRVEVRAEVSAEVRPEVHAEVHHFADPACSEPAVSVSLQGTLQGSRVAWSGGQGTVVRHAGLKGGDFGDLVGLKTVRLEQVHGRHKQRRVVVVRREGQMEIMEELVKYMKLSTNCR